MTDRTRFESKAAAYRWVANAVVNYQCGSGVDAPIIHVWVDERTRGWQLYERVNLKEWSEIW